MQSIEIANVRNVTPNFYKISLVKFHLRFVLGQLLFPGGQ